MRSSGVVALNCGRASSDAEVSAARIRMDKKRFIEWLNKNDRMCDQLEITGLDRGRLVLNLMVFFAWVNVMLPTVVHSCSHAVGSTCAEAASMAGASKPVVDATR